MNTPKQEAERIFEQYSDLIYDKLHHLLDCCADDVDIDTPLNSLVKQCAIIDVKNTIEEVGDYCDNNYHSDRMIFFQQVLNELNKM